MPRGKYPRKAKEQPAEQPQQIEGKDTKPAGHWLTNPARPPLVKDRAHARPR